MLEKIDVLLCLLAGLVVLILGIVLDMELAAILTRLLIALVVFYILGAIVKAYLRKTVFFEVEEDIDEEQEQGLEISGDNPDPGLELDLNASADVAAAETQDGDVTADEVQAEFAAHEVGRL